MLAHARNPNKIIPGVGNFRRIEEFNSWKALGLRSSSLNYREMKQLSQLSKCLTCTCMVFQVLAKVVERHRKIQNNPSKTEGQLIRRMLKSVMSKQHGIQRPGGGGGRCGQET